MSERRGVGVSADAAWGRRLRVKTPTTGGARLRPFFFPQQYLGIDLLFMLLADDGLSPPSCHGGNWKQQQVGGSGRTGLHEGLEGEGGRTRGSAVSPASIVVDGQN